MSLNDCYNFEDFRRLAKKNLLAPIFHFIDESVYSSCIGHDFDIFPQLNKHAHQSNQRAKHNRLVKFSRATEQQLNLKSYMQTVKCYV